MRTLVAAVVLAATSTTACRDDAAPAPSTSTVRKAVAPEEAAADGVLRIGAVLAATGPLAADEAPVLDALRAAVTWQNARGGVGGRPVELLVADTAGSVLDGARVAADLTEAGVDVLVVGCDLDVAATAARVARRAARVAVSPCASDDAFGVDTAGSAAFALAPAASAVADAVAGRLVAAGLRSTIFVSQLVPYESTGLCQRVANRYRELGGAVVAEVEIGPADAPDALVVALQRSATAAAFVTCAARGEVAAAVAAVRAARPGVPVLAAGGADAPPWPGGQPDGVTFATTAMLWPPDAALAPLVAAGARSGPALCTFVLVDVLAQAMAAAGPAGGTTALLGALRATTFPTALGPIRFDARQRAVGVPITFARTTAGGTGAEPARATP